MLKNEITPFAEHHRANLRHVKNFIKDVEKSLPADASPEKIDEIQEMLHHIDQAQGAFHRFEVCALDEWGQKERLQQQTRHCRENHK